MNYPSLCADDFYDDPDQIFEYAKTLEYREDPAGSWPGMRSPSIESINPDLHELLIRKVFSYFHDLNHVKISSNVVSYFQVIPPYSTEKYSAKNIGWIHKDGCDYAGIIYLCPDADLDTGTSIFREKIENPYIDYSPKKRLFLGASISDEEYEFAMNEHRSHFEEITRYNNVYNRLVAFNSNNFHAANCYKTTGKHPRLTQVFFMEDIKVT